MTQEDIIKLAREAGWTIGPATLNGLERFAKLIRDDYSNKHAALWLKRIKGAVEAEREACAAIAFNAKTYIKAAAAIRARGEQK